MRISSYLLVAASMCAAVTAPLGAAKTDPKVAFGQIPAWFEPAKSGGTYLARSAKAQVTVDGHGALLAHAGGAMSVRFTGTKGARALEGLERQQAATNYLIGQDKNAWRMQVPHFDRVKAVGVYPGVDVVYYHAGRQLEYDVVVAPGVDPSKVRMKFSGGRPVVQADGSLRLDGEFVQKAPYAYQEREGRKVEVASRYEVKGGEVRFAVGTYDKSLPLVIDPVVSFVGYVGGDDLDVVNAAIATPDGSYWVAGSAKTLYPYIPENIDPFSRENKGQIDGFLARITPNPNGYRITYYSFIGGTAFDEITAMTQTVNRIVVAGNTQSLDFPWAGYAPQQGNGGETDGFVAYYDPTEVSTLCLTYSTYYGGTKTEKVQAVATDSQYRAIIVGYTNAGELPKVISGAALQPSNRGGLDGFIVRLDPSQSAANGVSYASFFGGNSTDLFTAVAVDSKDKVYLAGTTMSWDMPLEGASYMSEPRWYGDAFLAKMDLDKTWYESFLYGTYFGGSGLDVLYSMTIDQQDRLWVTGYTESADLPVTPGAYQLGKAGDFDAFVARLDASKSGAAFVSYCSYLGGTKSDVANSIAYDRNTGMVTVAGYTTSSDFPVKGMENWEQPPVRQSESFATRLDPSKAGLSALVWSTTVGGAGMDSATSVALDRAGNAFVAGITTSSNLPVGDNPGKQNKAGVSTGFYYLIK